MSQAKPSNSLNVWVQCKSCNEKPDHDAHEGDTGQSRQPHPIVLYHYPCFQKQAKIQAYCIEVQSQPLYVHLMWSHRFLFHYPKFLCYHLHSH